MSDQLAWPEGKKATGQAVSAVGEQGTANSRVMPSLKVTFPGMGFDIPSRKWRFNGGACNQVDTWMDGSWHPGIWVDQSGTILAW